MLLLSTSSLTGYGLHRIFEFAKKARYDGMDISVDFDLFDTIDAEYLKDISTITGMPIVSLTTPERKLTRKNFDEILTLADTLGVKTVNVHPPHRLEKEKDWFGEYISTMNAKYEDTTINIINAPPKTWLFIISEYGDARPETIKKITEHTALSIANVDPSSGVDLMKTFILLGSTMGFVYLSDKTDEAEGLLPGEGTMPVESLLIKLRDIGYQGDFSLSVNPESLSAGGIEHDIVTKLISVRVFLAKYFG